ncbi:hypothetical protein CEY12_02390 [Chryseobacterium sp. T16E-39]|uniref:hypothetical protein n=1 Tax=Chryseobacterium sp. T16E-39 TaxID=2015076 RepID=UPI000B5B1806|nr:hypothetical protein [Chryseobacterium sp. T16E-39]ASK29025.1 hypothetical protein CEY12_02390 [Chryseobacterium sp. T16E-39]
MIKRVRYNEIDFNKYTQCLDHSEQRKYSASKTFLDVTSKKQWEILIYNDYEAVMPIPYVKKYGIKIVHNPMLCQQLGIFSKKDDASVNQAFLEFLTKHYLIRVYNFNDCNQFHSKLGLKKNFLILPDSYEKVYARYSPKRKRKLRLDLDTQNVSEIKILSFNEAKSFIEANMLGLNKEEDLGGFLRIFESFYKLGHVQFSAFYYRDRIINMIAVYEDASTMVLLGTFNDKEHVRISGASVLIDKAIKDHIETKLFDFEGGELPNIEEFFRGFRPEFRPYGILESSVKTLAKNLIQLLIKGRLSALK